MSREGSSWRAGATPVGVRPHGPPCRAASGRICQESATSCELTLNNHGQAKCFSPTAPTAQARARRAPNVTDRDIAKVAEHVLREASRVGGLEGEALAEVAPRFIKEFRSGASR